MEFGKNKYNYRQHIASCCKGKDADRYIAADLLEIYAWDARSDYAVFCLCCLCLETYTANRRYYVHICDDRRYYVQICDDHEDDIDTGIARKVRDMQICRRAKDPIEKLAQITNAIDVCQSEKTISLADVTNMWPQLAAIPLLPECLVSWLESRVVAQR